MMPKASRSGLAARMSVIACTPLAPSSLVKTGQPATSVQPPSPVERGEALLAGERVTHALGAAQDVVGAGVALDRADRAAVRLLLLDVLADALSPSGSCRCRDRSCGAPASSSARSASIVITGIVGFGGPDRLGDQLGVRRRDRDRGGVGLAEHVLHDLRLAGLVRGRGRAGVEALVLGVRRSREFHFSQPWWIASKKGLSSPFTTITSCLSAASAGPAQRATAAPAASKRDFRTCSSQCRGGSLHGPSSRHAKPRTSGSVNACRR